jgi:nucleoside-diphosphate-sugar epimerase
MDEYKKILLLGSEGQIGSYLTHYLDSKNYQVIQFDVSRNEEEDLRRYPNIRLEEAMKECDFVFFLAFDVGGSLYMKKYQDTYH